MPDRTRVAVLGSTGSIGRQALTVIEAHPEAFEVVALAAGRDAVTLGDQVAKHRPALVSLADETAARGFRVRAAHLAPGTRFVGGPGALVELAIDEMVDLVLVATGGIVSLRPVLAALESRKVVATANKETLVAGGHLVMPLARALAVRRSGAEPARGGSASAVAALAWLRPIDSEHSAIWQCLTGEARSDVARLVLTASGGPFRTWPAERLMSATAADALAHPTWRMGAKITVDSASLMNKGLEVIEARWLYDVDYDRIDVVIHPQSIVHSLVEFADGSLKAQLGLPDMRIPIQYALTHPRHLPSPAPRTDIAALPALSFEEPDERRFPAISIARAAGRSGPRASAALIAADEVAVTRFLSGELDFGGISRLCAAAVERFGGGTAEPSLPEILELDGEVRAWAETVYVSGASRFP